jgi:hypothetical protein
MMNYFDECGLAKYLQGSADKFELFDDLSRLVHVVYDSSGRNSKVFLKKNEITFRKSSSG